MSSYAEEFAKLYGGGCSYENKDWTEERFFDKSSDAYASEVALMSSLTSEAYNKYGFEVQYYIKEIDTKIDRLNGEDPLENIKRRFALNVYAETVPQNQKQYEIQGMVFTEMVSVQCTIQHFNEASQIDWDSGEAKYPRQLPKIGDIMYFPWNDLYYEILNVKTFAEGSSFLSAPITYTFTMRVWRNSHENVDYKQENTDNMSEIRSYAELGETFDLEHEHSEVKASGDILAINDNLEEPEQQLPIFVPKEKVTENPKSVDPFDGW